MLYPFSLTLDLYIQDESREDEDCEEWEEVDSCWGCYEETDELIKEVMIENGLEE